MERGAGAHVSRRERERERARAQRKARGSAHWRSSSACCGRDVSQLSPLVLCSAPTPLGASVTPAVASVQQVDKLAAKAPTQLAGRGNKTAGQPYMSIKFNENLKLVEFIRFRVTVVVMG